ncbi:hypothetical protein V5O48_018201 [Marasmius crinis-equi]|uniref:Uncharacterized protein n=1 Tax=Marasmius crinis-equi TaxID=585013 RepID=A0ABR3ELZ9_9AGAR
MTIFYPHNENIVFPTRETAEYARIAIGKFFPIFPEWNVDSILSFANHIIMVPDLHNAPYHPPCEPKVYRFSNVPKPHKWSVYMTDSNNPLAGEGIFPDHAIGRAHMPELPYYLEEDEDHIPMYRNNERRNGDESFHHKYRWDAPHSVGREKVAKWVMENTYTTKAMLVIKVLAEVYPALAVREMRNGFLPASNNHVIPDPFTAQTLQGLGSTSSKVETGTLQPIIKPLGKSLWVFTREEYVNFDSLCLAYLHAQHVTDNGKKAGFIFSCHLEGARGAFEDVMLKEEDAENNALLRKQAQASAA